MKVAMMQPAFLPWQGFFELIYSADCFIFLNDFQFSVQSYHQRNRLFTSSGKVGWYTVPVVKAASFGVSLNCALVDDSASWRKKMLKRLQHNYSRTPFFSAIFPVMEACLNAQAVSLADLNMVFIRSVLDLFGWKRELRFSSDLQSEAKRSSRVIELLHWCSATQYYSARGSFGYMCEDGLFPRADLEILFQDFVPAPHSQLGALGEFVPFLSVLDALFNIGPVETAKIASCGTSRWLKWNDMMMVHVCRKGEGDTVEASI